MKDNFIRILRIGFGGYFNILTTTDIQLSKNYKKTI